MPSPQHIGAYYLWPFIAGGGERYVMVSTSYPGNGWVREVVYLGSSVTAALGCGTTYYYGEWWYDGKSGCYWHWWDGFARKWYTVYDCTWQGPGG